MQNFTDCDIFLFGMGVNFYSYADRLDKILNVRGFVDNNSQKWGTAPFGDDRIVISPNELKNFNNPIVIIIPIDKNIIDEIKKQCDILHVKYVLVSEILSNYNMENYFVNWPETIQKERIHRFIEIQLRDTTTCNFHCSYCYVWRNDGYKEGTKTCDYSMKDIRKAFSISRLGGVCAINICASGETMLSKDIVPLVREMLAEGHYVNVVTNGTISKKIKEILDFPKNYLKRMFFKLSYHYLELQRTKLHDIFWQNVDLIKNSPASYTLEITPCDELIPHINEIKKIFNEKANGAMPHITFTRDSTKPNFDLYSDISLKKYKEIWNQFNSKMFELKSQLYNRTISEYCYAGNWTFNVSFQNGNMQTCYRQTKFFPFFKNISSSLPTNTVGKNCALKYCFNAHAFIAQGNVPEIECYNYLDMRDIVDNDGNHSVKPFYARFMKQKLYDNNFIYHNTWPDYEKLFSIDRKPAFILFNSPDYGNLGDHAIAYGTKNFFKKYFPEFNFIEIACEEYVLENLKIKNYILKDDILLICGGGYLGTLWPKFDDITRYIISHFKQNKIFILPNTLYFEDTIFGNSEKKAEAKCFNAHKNLYMALREEKSYNLALEMFDFKERIVLVPDMAFNIDIVRNTNRKNAIICQRHDKESTNNYYLETIQALEELSIDFIEQDTVTKNKINMINREENLKNLILNFLNAKIIITDRLHGVILSAITNTPCLFFNNISKKISSTYNTWLKNLNYIKFHNDKNKIKDEIKNLISAPATIEQQTFNKIYSEFEKYARFIKKEME